MYISVKEGCKEFGVSKPTLLKAIHAGQIPFLRIGKRILIPVDKIEILRGVSTCQNKRGEKIY